MEHSPHHDDVLSRLVVVETKLDAHLTNAAVILARIDTSVQSLLDSRSFVRGLTKALVFMSAVVSAIISAIVAYFHK